METLKKKVLEELLQIDCHNIAIKLGFITQSSRAISTELIAKVIRCLRILILIILLQFSL